MGTRADFYVGRGEDAEWIGSIAFDGYPDGIAASVLHANTEADYRTAVSDFLTVEASHATLPDEGWPWPWETSATTDYAYAFDVGKVYGACFGYEWFDATQSEPEADDNMGKQCVFPEMRTDRAKMPGARGSGVMLITPQGVFSEESNA